MIAIQIPKNLFIYFDDYTIIHLECDELHRDYV